MNSSIIIGTLCRLKGITLKGKNRIREHGEIWEILEPIVSPRPDRLFVKSVKTGDVRWVTSDFSVLPV